MYNKLEHSSFCILLVDFECCVLETKITVVSSATTGMSMLWYGVAVVRAQHCAWPTDLFAQDLQTSV